MRCCLVVLSLFFSALVYSQSDTSKIVFAEDVWLGQELPLEVDSNAQDWKYNDAGMCLPEGKYDIYFNKKDLTYRIEKASFKSVKGLKKDSIKIFGSEAYSSKNGQAYFSAPMWRLKDDVVMASGVELNHFYRIKFKSKRITYLQKNRGNISNQFFPSFKLYSQFMRSKIDLNENFHLRDFLLCLDNISDFSKSYDNKGKEVVDVQPFQLMEKGKVGILVNDHEIIVNGLKFETRGFYPQSFKSTQINKTCTFLLPDVSKDKLDFELYEFSKNLVVGRGVGESVPYEVLSVSNVIVVGSAEFNLEKVLRLEDSQFGRLHISGGESSRISIENSKIELDSLAQELALTFLPTEEKNQFDSFGNPIFFEEFFSINIPFNGNGDVSITESSFKNFNSSLGFKINGGCSKVTIQKNVIETPILLRGKSVDLFVLKNNLLSENANLVIDEFSFPENFMNIKIDWRDLKGGKLAAKRLYTNDKNGRFTIKDSLESYYSSWSSAFVTYKATSDNELKDRDMFLEYIKPYYFFHSVYKSVGNIKAANQVLVELKDAEMRELRYIYESEGGLKNWFRWWLSWLLKTYTEHGTDPAKALVISFWIIIGFSVFYFFFPSDWDLYSKSAIIKNFRQALDKNDKKIFTPFLKAVLYFLVSFANAFTLSINSFVTLGFGQIPARGVAKYVTILQGFMGWFLLSIFSVALINQVLG